MAVFTSTFAAVAVTAAQDVFEITAPATSKIAIREVRIGQYSDAGDAAAELLSVQIIRGYTVSGSGGSAGTSNPVAGHSGAITSTAAIETNNTTVANTGSPVIMIADAFNVQAGWIYVPDPDERITIAVSTRLVVRITAPADSITMNGTLVYEEIGQ